MAKERESHGGSGTPLYGVWCSMRSRCENVSATFFAAYGGRGISVCDEWRLSFAAFRAWSADSGYRPGLTLDRVDNDGDYEPTNCQWIDRRAQARNRRSNVVVEAFGERRLISDWASDRRCQVNVGTLRKRLRRGLSPEQAICLPPSTGPYAKTQGDRK